LRVVTVNTGADTIKAALADVEAGAAHVLVHHVEPRPASGGCRAQVLRAIRAVAPDPAGIEAVGHRVVHGGPFHDSILIDDRIESALETFARFARRHNIAALEGIAAAGEVFPGRPMVAVFDTSFHAHRPPESMRYALPADVVERLGLVRYGFHGLAHASLVRALAQATAVEPARVTAVTLQLGAGCSACAVQAGRSIETSMGFTPLEGLVMTTRCGDLDPGAVLHLVDQGYGPEDAWSLLGERSGLLALGGSASVPELLARESAGDARAGLALRVFVRRIAMTVGAYLTLLGGRGAIVFGGGIGTNSATIRARVATALQAWDVRLDANRNEVGTPGEISARGTRPVWVFSTDEEREIAEEAARVLAGRTTTWVV
jgi:acetate kinase